MACRAQALALLRDHFQSPEQAQALEPLADAAPAAQPHAFDEQALARWLAVELPGFEGPLTVQRFKDRQSNPTSRVRQLWT